jgi:hypothetical protein
MVPNVKFGHLGRLRKEFSMRALLLATALVMAAPASAATLITNGGFETGDFTGWTLSVAQVATSVIDAPANVNTGTYAARLRTTAGNPIRTLSQSVATNAGYRYELSYWLRNTGVVSDSFEVESGATTVSFGDRGTFGYTQFSQEFFGLAGSTQILFRYDHLQPGAFFLDDVVVSVIPEPRAWALLIAGFGLVGAAMRRRQAAVAA